jgi:formylmethanofuran dehydrogenase subunit D
MKKGDTFVRELIVTPTDVTKQPSTDFIVILNPDDMKNFGIKENDYVLLQNDVHHEFFCWTNLKNDAKEKIKVLRFLNRQFKIEIEHKDLTFTFAESKIIISDKDISIEISINLETSKTLVKINENITEFALDLDKEKKIIVGEKKVLEIYAQVISALHSTSKIKNLVCGNVGIDETYRNALGLRKGERVRIVKTKKRYGFKQKLLTSLNYQKAVVRVQQNVPYMEQRIPVVCLCDEIVNSIGARYGDQIIVETKDRSLSVRCARSTEQMEEFHDLVISPPLEIPQRNNDAEKFERIYFRIPWNLLTKWGRLAEPHGDLIHPIFMDSIARKKLNVKELEPVKIRRSFIWETKKKLNSFGALALFAVSIMIPQIINSPIENVIYLLLLALPLVGLVIWSVFTASEYRESK